MCNLCSPDKEAQDAERAALRRAARDMCRFACFLRHLEEGREHPHSEEAVRKAALARNIIRYLVEEWM